MKKHIIIACLSLGMSVACSAQKPLSKTEDGLIKSKVITYKLDKSSSKYMTVENSANKLSKTELIAPNWPSNVSPARYITTDQKLLVAICSDILPLEKVKELPTGIIDVLSVRIWADLTGKPIEISFVTQKNSILTIEELEKIELAIKKKVMINVSPDFKKFLVGANFIILDTRIYYREIVAAKIHK